MTIASHSVTKPLQEESGFFSPPCHHAAVGSNRMSSSAFYLKDEHTLLCLPLPVLQPPDTTLVAFLGPAPLSWEPEAGGNKDRVWRAEQSGFPQPAGYSLARTPKIHCMAQTFLTGKVLCRLMFNLLCTRTPQILFLQSCFLYMQSNNAERKQNAISKYVHTIL